MLVEPTPAFSQTEAGKIGQQAFVLLTNPDFQSLVRRINNDYLYWDKAKYHRPEDVDPAVFWTAIKFLRLARIQTLQFGGFTFSYSLTDRMQSLLNQFDMNFGGMLNSASIIPEQDKQMYLVSSIMEEAIASSQMEGANTTRKVAKEMLRKQQTPENKDQQMILNNYETIRYISEHKDEAFSVPNIKIIHSYISRGTLDDEQMEGTFRTSDDVVVQNAITGTVVHTPPAFAQIEPMLEDLCAFANDDSMENFIHPIIKAIIIHFMLAYIHPFVDGNGRTARSLFYWYMIKKGYWLTEYLSISRVIYKSKAGYEKAYIYTEADMNDISYFIHYNLLAMQKAYEQLKEWLEEQSKKRKSIERFRTIEGINDRQIHLLRLFMENHNMDMRVKEVATRFNVTPHTARTDLQHLAELGLLHEIAIDKKTKAYVRTAGFEDILDGLSK
ncbi:MAG: Fic family protein [Paludibacteraceae bacterium]|nr:Fic family protein [Paludibacteraceae bacterium]